MSTAALPARILTTSNTITDVQCTVCEKDMTVSPNPYFGTALAVHRLIAECDRCGAVAFVPEPEPTPSFMERMVAIVRGVFAGAGRSAA